MKETQQNKTPSKGVRVVKAILNTIINILIVLVLVTSILIAVLSLSSKSNNGVATVFGYSFHTIQTPSMVGGNPDYAGGDYQVGDLVIGKAEGAGDRDYQVGDIISYRTEGDNGDTMLICHRIIDVADDGGAKTYQTQGDANDTPDQDTPDEYLHNYDIASLCYDADYHGKVLSGWGKPLDYIRQPQGFFFAVLLPMIIFFMYEIFRVVLNAMSYKKTKEEESREDAEKEKNEAVKAAVAAALAAKDAEEKKEAEKETSGNESPEGTGSEDKPEVEAKSDEKTTAQVDMTPEQLEQFKQFMEFQKMQNLKQAAEEKESEPPTEE